LSVLDAFLESGESEEVVGVKKDSDSDLFFLDDDEFFEPEKFTNILIVDNEDEILDSVRAQIESISSSYSVTTLTNVDDILGNFESDEYDLVITDLNFENCTANGYDFIRLLRDVSKNIPIVVLSASQPDFKQFDEYDVNYFLQKPRNPDELKALLFSAEKGGLRKNYSISGRESSKQSYLFYKKRRNPELLIEDELRALMNSCKADAISLLSASETGEEIVEMIKMGDIEFYRNKSYASLKESPVTDALIDRETIYKNDFRIKSSSKFKNIINSIKDMRSFIGIPVECFTKNHSYAIFLFRKDFFMKENFFEAQAVTSKLAYLLDLKNMQTAFANQQKFLVAGQTLTSVFHDIRNDIEKIAGKIELLNSLAKSGDENIALKITELNNQKNLFLRKFSNIKNLYDEASLGIVYLKGVFEDVSGYMKKQLEDSNITLNVSFDDNIPKLRGYKIRVQQILINLILNAEYHLLEFRQEKRVIELSAEYQPESEFPVVIRVSDNGPGIHTKDADKIFDLFFSTKEGKGMGLGLFMCRSLADSMNGRLSLEKSFIYFGSVFKLELRLK